jgi:dTDP-4-dehydrorhamnose reductase
MTQSPHILVLGAEGMLGQMVFKYLKKTRKKTIWATSRNYNVKELLFFEATTYKKDLKKIINKLGYIDYLINCIGILKNSTDKEQMYYINAELPHLLSRFALKNKFKIIHVSTDGVFSDNAGLVNESNRPLPTEDYGTSKLLGELRDVHTITIRTSLLGLDPLKHTGLLESILMKRKQKIDGYINQKWSGCTTLQLAQFINWLINDNNFQNIREKTPLLHFAPIHDTNKYTILKTFFRITNTNSHVVESNANPITRILVSQYIDNEFLSNYIDDLDKALRNLCFYYKNYLSTYEK